MRIRDGDDRPHLLFGDIHGHTLRSDGRGTPEQFHTYCRDVAALSFCALTEHDFMLSDASWDDIQRVVEDFNEPGRYATIQAFEWSGLSELGGDHNVYFRGSDTTLLRSRSYYDYRNQQTYHGPAPQVNFIEDLYSALLRDYPLGEVMTIPHYGGRPANPNWHEPRLERMIEIMSDHQRSHEWAYEFLRKGYRLGFMASSDNHTGRPGYGFLQNPLLSAAGTETGTSLVAVYADELTRESVFDALYDRYAYATSGERILLDMRMGDWRMGQEADGEDMPPLVVSVEATATVERIDILKDAVVVGSIPGEGESMSLEWSDPTPPGVGGTAAYWVRIVQTDNEEAVSSPIWWTQR